ncbi:hypothetical protein MNR01_11980 [Lysobacter sp. S4-A87]|uniref:hypothetical protein n=1 Tax=Lysobacter sp. S4-A87 TaxID=2925843 RepID=UPI001F52FE83|nr:hypothetical protein [Lysobacter sp. S4-A87]UNK48475.1 hypothetical protein MNR01_11980 [Lysobacter sp. S4-A87]
MSAIYRNHPGFKNYIEAAAFLRVAYILGDGKAAGQILKDFPKYGPVDYTIIDRRASSLYRTFAKERRPSVRPVSR